MGPNAVNLLTLAAAALELGCARYYFYAPFDKARPLLPRPLQGELSARFAVDRFIWDGAVPLAARRDYLLSHVFASVGFACLTVLALAQGPLAGGLLFVTVTALALADTWLCWRKYRRSR